MNYSFKKMTAAAMRRRILEAVLFGALVGALALAAAWWSKKRALPIHVIQNGGGRAYLPCQHAGRFSKNAVMPSCASWAAAFIDITSFA
jgi:hypothetical protein